LNPIKRVVVAFGTRPEATKLAPVIYALREQPGLEPIVLVTGQHRQQLEAGLAVFGIKPDDDLEVMTDRQTLPGLTGRIVPAAAERLKALEADYVLVQGDTLTTFCVALASFFEGIPVGHVEAGLRSGNMREPFPEEADRRLTSVLADLDMPPTPGARENLLREGKDPATIVVTGQTAVDAVRIAAGRASLPAGVAPGKLVTVTMHRRENWPLLGDLAGALATIARRHPDYSFVYPVHLNPVVREAVRPVLESVPNFRLIEPIEYGEMAALMAASDLMVTDSGGLQEEGASLNVPVVVLRNVTERPEGVEAGVLKLAGTEPDNVVRIVDELLSDEGARNAMRGRPNPYGDGHASERVAAAVAWRLGLGDRPKDWS
jgi:UDP-N-acetylglucosamine 2-epimerase (non-hydrolysing)